jgi:DeoR/GlpR family transcriptional regulator of sugar metabolism
MKQTASQYLSPDSRRQQILEGLERSGELSVEALAERFSVSGMTIRRDLQELADEGRVIRTRGGAAAAGRVSFEFGFLERAQRQSAEKDQIARRATSLVQPGQSVLLDSSTTTLAIARRLVMIPGLTVITTSLPVASELFGREGIDVIILGGQLRDSSPDLTGALTDQNLELIRADIAFIGADAIDDAGYIYNSSSEIGRMLKAMARAAGRVYAVADHTKLGRHELMRFAHVADWQGLITDDRADSSRLARLASAGVALLPPETEATSESQSQPDPTAPTELGID